MFFKFPDTEIKDWSIFMSFYKKGPSTALWQSTYLYITPLVCYVL